MFDIEFCPNGISKKDNFISNLNKNKFNYLSGTVEILKSDNPPPSLYLQIGVNSYKSMTNPQTLPKSYLYKISYDGPNSSNINDVIIRDLITNDILDIKNYIITLHYREFKHEDINLILPDFKFLFFVFGTISLLTYMIYK